MSGPETRRISTDDILSMSNCHQTETTALRKSYHQNCHALRSACLAASKRLDASHEYSCLELSCPLRGCATYRCRRSSLRPSRRDQIGYVATPMNVPITRMMWTIPLAMSVPGGG